MSGPPEFLHSSFTVTNKNKYIVLFQRDGSELETLEPGQTSKQYSDTGAYKVEPFRLPPSQDTLAEIDVTRLLGALDNTYKTTRYVDGNIGVNIDLVENHEP